MINYPVLIDKGLTADQLLDNGNYAYAYHKAESPQTIACAKIMCGAIDAGLTELESLKTLTGSSRVIQAYGYWCLKKNSRAIQILRGIDNKIAQRFHHFIKNGAKVFICASPESKKIKNFENIQLSYQPIDQLHFTKSIDIRNDKIDLIISNGVYGVNIPNNFFTIDCPTAFWVGDHDFFYSTRYNDFSKASILVTNSAGEHIELSEHYSARIASFPGHESYQNSNEYPKSIKNKDLDIGFTGRAFVPYMPDKARFLFKFITLNDPKLNIRIYNGYLSDNAFKLVMKKSRFIPLFWRYAGGIQTRAIDALRYGASIFSPEEVTTGALLGGDDSGFIGLGPERFDLKIKSGLKNYRSFLDSRSHSNYFRSLFWSNPSREQRFIKFCLFQSIFNKFIPKNKANNNLIPAELRGYQPADAIKTYVSIAKRNIDADDKTVSHYNFAAAALFFAAISGDGNNSLGRSSIDIYTQGQKLFPNNLVLKFNAARVLWTFNAKPESIILFKEIVFQNKILEFNPKDGVLSHRIRELSDMFSYGEYYKLALKDAKRAEEMIQSCSFTYLGVYAFETKEAVKAKGYLKEALQIDNKNVSAYRWLTEVLNFLSADKTEILQIFYQAITLYPPHLCHLLPIGVKAELGKRNIKKASTLLNNWVLYHLRVREPSGKLLPLHQGSLKILNDNKLLLKKWVSKEFEKLKSEMVS